ncbi:MAG: hypothetical protein ABSA93_31445 [Streptosporangiaceae bacterium]
MLTDGAGRAQWLLSCWRTATLRIASESYAGNSLGGLLDPLALARIRPADEAWLDCDTPADVDRACQSS